MTEPYRDPKTGRWLPGVPGWHQGKTMPLEVKRKLSLSRRGKYAGANCYWWGRTLSLEHKRKISETKSRAQTGAENPNWRGGTSLGPYAEGWYGLKKRIRTRDQHVCQIPGCSKGENGRHHDVHHIDYNKNNDNLDNLITLCLPCHRRTNGNREYWMQYFSEIMAARFVEHRRTTENLLSSFSAENI